MGDFFVAIVSSWLQHIDTDITTGPHIDRDITTAPHVGELLAPPLLHSMGSVDSLAGLKISFKRTLRRDSLEISVYAGLFTEYTKHGVNGS